MGNTLHLKEQKFTIDFMHLSVSLPGIISFIFQKQLLSTLCCCCSVTKSCLTLATSWTAAHHASLSSSVSWKSARIHIHTVHHSTLQITSLTWSQARLILIDYAPVGMLLHSQVKNHCTKLSPWLQVLFPFLVTYTSSSRIPEISV